MLNRCEFIGNLGRDPDCRTMNNGDPVVNLSLAVTEKWKTKEGEPKEATTWIPIVIFNPHLCKTAQNHLKKGSRIYVTGRWQTRKWTDQSGVEKYTTECVLQRFDGNFLMLDGKPEGGSYTDRNFGGESQTSGGDDLADEIPF